MMNVNEHPKNMLGQWIDFDRRKGIRLYSTGQTQPDRNKALLMD